MKNFLHHLFIPRESNNHRSKLLHYEVIVLFIAFLFSSLIVMAGVHKQYPAVLGEATNMSVQDLLRETNLKRALNGVAPLKLNSELSQAADMKAKDMFAKNYWAHISPDGTTPWVFIKDSGYQYLYAGENLARGYNSSADVVNAWMNSPTHRENLLSPHYTDIGFAVQSGLLTGSDTVLVVQEFGSKYIPSDQTADSEEIAAVPSSSPTNPIVGPTVALQKAIALGTVPAQVTPTFVPSPTQQTVPIAANQKPDSLAGVAAVQNNPLVDSSTIKRNTSFFFLLFFIAVLVIDAIVIERKQIVRVFSHNVDHILFLLFILFAGFIIGRGVIL
jgi:hypothetical protein